MNFGYGISVSEPFLGINLGITIPARHCDRILFSRPDWRFIFRNRNGMRANQTYTTGAIQKNERNISIE